MSNNGELAYRSIQRHLRCGTALVLFIAVGIGGWSATTELSGAVVVQGVLVVDSNIKKVQHQIGGTIAELRVREGDFVNEGDIVARLDDTQAKVAAAIVSKNLDDLDARQARLEAERDDADSVVFPTDLVRRAKIGSAEPTSQAASNLSSLGLRASLIGSGASDDVSHAIATERRLFELRRQARNGQKAQLRERISQLKEEILGYRGQLSAKLREIELIAHELQGLQELRNKDLVPLSRLTTLQRDAARLDGERSQLLGATAQANGKIAEIELQLVQIDQDLRTEVGKELAEVRSKISELVERKVAAEDQLKHINIRAPRSGKVLQLAVHSAGGVIAPGESIMMIVPDEDSLTAEVRVSPLDIAQVNIGQETVLKFSSFNQRTTPEISGEVKLISADLNQDQRTGSSYYTVRISPSPSDFGRLGKVKLIPGMPVEAFIKTGERTVLSYLTKPIRDQASRAFTEQ